MNKDNQVFTNSLWQSLVRNLYEFPEYISSPRGLTIHETINGHYQVPMPAFLTIKERKVNYSFMFAEAAWILSGSNRVSDIEGYMKIYRNFSDDKVFLKGAYGPKVIEQLGYVVDTLVNDVDSRQAVLSIWRERPGTSKDIPCTLTMQFFIRDGKLDCVTNMRSNDIVKGFTYDIFTFSMISLAVLLLLKSRGTPVSLGELYVNAGSLHLYESDIKNVDKWVFNDNTINIDKHIEEILGVNSYEELISILQNKANEFKKVKK